MNCVSLFSGAGGLDLGLEAAGFTIAASLELDSDCCATLRLNGRENVSNEDVAHFDFAALGEATKIDLLAGGPPCQPFSKSALWTKAGTRGIADPRSSTLTHYFRAIECLQPTAFVLENVEGFPRLGGLKLLKKKLRQLQSMGLDYHLQYAVLNAANFGVPQKRSRFFAVGVRGGAEFVFPRPTHGVSEKYATAWDACAELVTNPADEVLQPRGRWAQLLTSIPPGRNYLWHTHRGDGLAIFGWRTRYWSFLYKLDPTQPSPTIVANPSQNSGPFHWENRLLTTAELAAIQTFPRDYAFFGERASRQRQIGNAVPPLMAEHLGRSVMAALGGVVPRELVHVTPRAQQSALVPPIVNVPEQYLSLIGEHPDHPGAGLGPMARKKPKRRLARSA